MSNANILAAAVTLVLAAVALVCCLPARSREVKRLHEELARLQKLRNKPALPARPADPWPRIPVDTTEDSPFADVLRIGIRAANVWTFGPDGPYRKPQTPAQIASGQIHEALLHLLELGLIDIDVERLHAANFYPMNRVRTGTE